MSELEHCRLAHEGKLDQLRQTIFSNKFEDLSIKKDQVNKIKKNLKAKYVYLKQEDYI